MEFLTVYAQERITGEVHYDLPVLINGEANGYTGNPIKLDPGTIDVSVEAEHAESHHIRLENTTVTTPLKVTIMFGDEYPEIPDVPEFDGGPNV